MTPPTAVAFSWGADRYHEAARRLRGQLEDLGHPHRIHVDVDLRAHFARRPGPWKDRKWACRYIPTFLLRELELGGEDLLYLHSDFRVVREIPEAWTGLDVALQERWLWVPSSPLRPLAAPIFVRNCAPAVRFLRTWEALCLNVDDGNYEHDLLWQTFQLLEEKDRSLRLGWFEPHIATLLRDGDAPILGHKGGDQ